MEGLTAWQGAEKAIRPSACRKTLPDPGKGIAPLGGNRKRTAVPPPERNAATKTVSTRINRGQRPTRRARSARLGAGRALAGGLWPPAGMGSAWHCGRGDGPGQDAPGAQAEEFPAFRPGSPCGRHFFSTLLPHPQPCRIEMKGPRLIGGQESRLVHRKVMFAKQTDGQQALRGRIDIDQRFPTQLFHM